MQEQDVVKIESWELKPVNAICESGNVDPLNIPNSTPSTPTARNRFPLVRTGQDSGYGTDYSPSPSSNTSSRHFVFNDDMVAAGNVSVRKRLEVIELSKRLQGIQIKPEHNLDIVGDIEDVNGPELDVSLPDMHDEEVRNINEINNSACKHFGLPERPSAPLPCSIDSLASGDQCLGVGDIGTSAAFMKPLILRIEDKANAKEKELIPAQTVQVGSQSSADHLSRDRSHSMPNVRVLREQEVGRELRRLSDDFFHFHCNRRRQRTLSVESSTFPLRVNIDVYAGMTHTNRRTNNHDTHEDETINSRQ